MPSSRSKAASGLLSRGSFPTSLVDFVLKGCASAHTRRNYAKGIADFHAFAAGRPINSALLYDWRTAMAGTLSPATVNVRISAIRALVQAGRRTGKLSLEESTDLLNVGGLPVRGTRVGRWLTVPEVRRLLSVPSGKDLRGKRNYMILAILAGCALRLSDLTRVDVEQIQQRDGRWVFLNLVGKGGRVRTVPIPAWVKQGIDAWLKAAKLDSGRLVRQLTLKPEGLSHEGIRRIVSKAAQKIGVASFGPHDLRRTCARLCKEQGGDIEQIQHLLGHASVVTTQRYLGTVQNLRNAVNDNLGL